MAPCRDSGCRCGSGVGCGRWGKVGVGVSGIVKAGCTVAGQTNYDLCCRTVGWCSIARCSFARINKNTATRHKLGCSVSGQRGKNCKVKKAEWRHVRTKLAVGVMTRMLQVLVVTPSGRLTEVREGQPKKARSPMLVMPWGRTIEAREEQRSKAQ